MNTQPWIHVVTPHEDIRRGRLDESVFAADLSDVVADRGPLEYRDAALFFRKTYPTQGLVELLSAVLGRLSGKDSGEGVIQIQTPFGGGKTHSLIALYHIVAHGRDLGDEVAEILKRAGLDRVPEARVATFVGTAADALKGKTPWGELAAQLGRYELLADHDQKRRAPGKDLLHKLLSEAPTLILMDEVAEYAVKARDFRDQLVAFYQELTETVKVLPQCVLVVTLPSSAPYGEEGERSLHELQQVFKRVETIRTPVEGEEVYQVIRRRLFETIGSDRDIKRTADAFVALYQQIGDDLPREVREPAYRDRMMKAYPFHPEIIDVLFERWSTFPDFQRTRGVLRLLANLVSELYQKRHSAPLILPAHWNLANPAVRGEFLRHIGSEYQGVIASDIAASGNAKAEQIDRQLGSEYARFEVAKGLATVIFFGSFSGSERQGVGIQRLRLALLQPELPPAIVGDALRRLEEELWYVHAEQGIYRFSTKPNLNRVIVEKEEAVRPEQIAEELRDRLAKLAGRELQVVLCPRTPQDVADTRELKLAVLDPDRMRTANDTETFVRELLEKCGQTFRVWRNAIVVLVADGGELAGLRQLVKRFLAYRAIGEDKSLMKQLSDESRRTVEGKIKELEGGIAHRIMSAYRHLAKAAEGGVQWFDMGLPTVGAERTLAGRVVSYLKGEDLLLGKISPQRVVQKAMRADEAEKTVADIWDVFLRYPSMPMLESFAVLQAALADGVREGAFGLRIGDRTYFRESLAPDRIEREAVIVRDVAEPAAHTTELAAVAEAVPSQQITSGAMPSVQSLAAPAASPSMGRRVQQYRLMAQIPWDQQSHFFSGVVVPLQRECAELRIVITLEARGTIAEATLKHQVRETLQQIGANVLDEHAE